MCWPLNDVDGKACRSRVGMRTYSLLWQCQLGRPRLQGLTEPSYCSQVHRECREQPHGNEGGNVWGRGLHTSYPCIPSWVEHIWAIRSPYKCLEHSLQKFSDPFPAHVPRLGTFPQLQESAHSREGTWEHLGTSRK